jgi:hypothetical protein
MGSIHLSEMELNRDISISIVKITLCIILSGVRERINRKMVEAGACMIIGLKYKSAYS